MNEHCQRIKSANFHFNRLFMFYNANEEEVKKEILNLLSKKATRVGGIPTKILSHNK